MQARIRLEVGDTPLDVYVVHMSYDRGAQCAHAREIQALLGELRQGVEDWVIMGDFNVYADHEAAADILLGQKPLGKVPPPPR